MATHQRKRPESPAERGLRLAQMRWDLMRPEDKAGTKRPGSVKKHGLVGGRKGSHGRPPWFHRMPPKGWIP